MQSKIILPEQLNSIEKQIKDLAIPYNYDTKEYPIEVLLHKFNSVNNNKPQLFIPDYQREFVWPNAMICRFIESLFLGVPVQPIFASIIDEDGRLEIIDGSQRTRAINEFVNNNLELRGLKKIDSLNGFRFLDLPLSRQNKFNLITVRLHVVTDKADLQIRQDIFNRINTSGVKLSDSETRKGVYSSKFYDFIIECANNSEFNDLCFYDDNKTGNKRSKFANRGEKEELVLRFFAYTNSDITSSMRGGKDFLDDFLEKTNKVDFDRDALEEKFKRMLFFVKQNFTYGFKKSQNSKSTPNVRFEAIAIGVHLALEVNSSLVPTSMNWLNSEEFKEKTTSDSSGNSGRLKERVEFVRDCLLGKIEESSLIFKTDYIENNDDEDNDFSEPKLF